MSAEKADEPQAVTTETRLPAREITIGYDKRIISESLERRHPRRRVHGHRRAQRLRQVDAAAGAVAAAHPDAGSVLLDGKAITSYPAKEVARRLGLLPQSSIAPDGITVADLVARGRYPHQKLIRQWSEDDETAVVAAMEATGVTELSGRLVDELSGGQRQRVWVAMVLAQQTPLMLLDEPTTFLDIAHQIELLELCADLNRTKGRTLVAVLHDLNHACRYADHIIAMKDGQIVAQGKPADIITAELVEDVFGLPCRIIDDPESLTPVGDPAGPASLTLTWILTDPVPDLIG